MGRLLHRWNTNPNLIVQEAGAAPLSLPQYYGCPIHSAVSSRNGWETASPRFPSFRRTFFNDFKVLSRIFSTKPRQFQRLCLSFPRNRCISKYTFSVVRQFFLAKQCIPNSTPSEATRKLLTTTNLKGMCFSQYISQTGSAGLLPRNVSAIARKFRDS